MINLIKKYKALSFGVITVIILFLIVFLRSPQQQANKSHFDKLETSTPAETNTISEEKNTEVDKTDKSTTSNIEETSNTIENPFVTKTSSEKPNQKVKNFENILNENSTTNGQYAQEKAQSVNNEEEFYTSLKNNLQEEQPQVKNQQAELPPLQTQEIPTEKPTNTTKVESITTQTVAEPLTTQQPPQQESNNNYKEQKCQVAECEKTKYSTGEERAKDIKENEAMLFDYNGLIVNSYKQLEYLNLQNVFSFSEKENCINIINEKEWCIDEVRYGTQLIKIDKDKKIIRIKILKDSVYVNLKINNKERK